MSVSDCVYAMAGGPKLLQMEANLSALIFATIKAIRPPEVRRRAACGGSFHKPLENARQASPHFSIGACPETH